MSSRMGRLLSVQIFGESHGPSIGVTMDGLPAGLKIDIDKLNTMLARRAARSALATARREADIPRIISGMVDNVTTGQPLTAVFENGDTHSSDYSFLPDRPRPGHADLPATLRSKYWDDLRGSGHHSGRLTLPYVFAGGIAMQLLETQGILIAAHVKSIGSVQDDALNPVSPNMEALFASHQLAIPTLNASKCEEMQQAILNARSEQNSIGGVVECAVTGLPIGLGASFFEGVESVMASALFSIPAVKGVEFGAGFGAAAMMGSEYNDPYRMQGEKIVTTSNNAGGLLGGYTNGMPIIVRAAFRPTPSIGLTQQTISLKEQADTTLTVQGRHDPCVVVRAVPVVESAVAVSLLELWLEARMVSPLTDGRRQE